MKENNAYKSNGDVIVEFYVEDVHGVLSNRSYIDRILYENQPNLEENLQHQVGLFLQNYALRIF